MQLIDGSEKVCCGEDLEGGGGVQVLGVNLKDAAWFSAVPWAMMAAVGFVAGTSSDLLVQAGASVTTTRKIMQAIGFLGPAVALLSLNAVSSPLVAAAWLTAAVGLSAFSQAGFLVNYQEIGPKYAGVLHGKESPQFLFISAPNAQPKPDPNEFH